VIPPDDLDELDGFDGLGDGSESPREVWFLNRTLSMMRARKPFLTWMLRTWEDADGLTLADLRSRPTAVLVPPFEEELEVREWILDNAAALIQVALQDWFVPPPLWPDELDADRLARWFELELVECVWDLVDGYLTSDPDGESVLLRELDEEDFAPA
jgi:hypothetical protein